MDTGEANEDDAGRVKIGTGWSENGRGGNIDLLAGNSKSKSYRKSFDGADINLRAGDSETRGGTGGSVRMSGGSGHFEDRRDGGNGGSVELYGGRGSGLNKITDVGKRFYLCMKRSPKASF